MPSHTPRSVLASGGLKHARWPTKVSRLGASLALGSILCLLVLYLLTLQSQARVYLLLACRAMQCRRILNDDRWQCRTCSGLGRRPWGCEYSLTKGVGARG